MTKTKATKQPRGFILYEGPSLIDGQPIVVIATTKSANQKTANMVQTWIMRADKEPHLAVESGADAAVCGDCPHRPALGGSCYVLTFQGPLSVFRAYKRGRYAREWNPSDFRGRMVRLGAYGDPAAVPMHVWRAFTMHASGVTGYTHQWRDCDPALADVCMASCDTPADHADAFAAGWRTFRVRLLDEPLSPAERVCPASHEAGQKVTCEQCGACDGNRRNLKGNIAIIAHGARAVHFETWRRA